MDKIRKYSIFGNHYYAIAVSQIVKTWDINGILTKETQISRDKCDSVSQSPMRRPNTYGFIAYWLDPSARGIL